MNKKFKMKNVMITLKTLNLFKKYNDKINPITLNNHKGYLKKLFTI